MSKYGRKRKATSDRDTDNDVSETLVEITPKAVDVFNKVVDVKKLREDVLGTVAMMTREEEQPGSSVEGAIGGQAIEITPTETGMYRLR